MRAMENNDLLEKCLQQLQAGKPLETILAEGGQQVEAIRPLLETALRAQSLGKPAPVSLAAQRRSRAKFLAAAAQARAHHPLFWLPRLRFSTAALIVGIALAFAALLGTGLVSAQTLPGDTLYPVKIAVEQARLTFTPGTASRLALQETFDQERAEETERMIQLGRSQPASFAGFLRREEGEEWEVSGLPLNPTSAEKTRMAGLEGLYVEVQGHPSGERFSVDSIEVRRFSITGTLMKIWPDHWLVDSVTVHINSQTQVQLDPRPGLQVYLSAMLLENGEWVALVASAAPENGVIYQAPTQTPGEPQPATAPPQQTQVEDSGHPTETPAGEVEHNYTASTPTPEQHDTIEQQKSTEQHDGSRPEGGDSQNSDHSGD